MELNAATRLTAAQAPEFAIHDALQKIYGGGNVGGTLDSEDDSVTCYVKKPVTSDELLHLQKMLKVGPHQIQVVPSTKPHLIAIRVDITSMAKTNVPDHESHPGYK